MGSAVLGSPRPAIASNPATESRLLRIVTVMNCNRSIAGGMPVHSAMLTRELRRLGHHVENLFLDDVPGWVARKGFNYTLFAPLIARQIRRIEEHSAPFDVIQFSGGDGFLAPLLRRDRFGRRRLVVARSHGLEHLYWRAFQEEVAGGYEHCSIAHRLYFGGLRLWEVEKAVRAADLFICHTYGEMEFVTRHGWKSRAQIGVTPSGVPPDWLDVPLDPLPRNRILWSGSWQWPKGKRLLVDVFSALAARSDVRLTVVGTVAERHVVLAAFPPEVRAQVDVIADIPHAQMPELFKTHSMLLATSVYEGFGAIVAEAMAAGLPVVASRAGGWPQYVRSADTGVLVDTWDPEAFVAGSRWLLNLSDDDLLSIRIRARDAISELSWLGQAVDLARQFNRSLSRLVQ
jgi:glycosyltransferase involved in cell wall biosynthesis